MVSVSSLAPVLFVLVFVAIVGLVIWLFVRSNRRDKTMRDETVGGDLAALAAERGWSYQPENVGYLDQFSGLPFGGARGHRALQLVSGTYRGREFSCLQYVTDTSSYTGDGGGYQRYYRVFTIGLPVPRPQLQVIAMQKAQAMRKFTTGDAEFDQVFTVASEDDRFTADVLTAPNRQWLLGDRRARELPFRFEGGHLLTWFEQKDRFDPVSVEPVLDYLCDLLDRVAPDALR
ncbi:hypothetical protein [Amycolatopsis nigrescens]|uniref:hypothetical protein n=1 Tax=Amycolatopsis nigrescens TaxID=381445 RepID=UPI00037094E7|nr:hypothetical protein [Amycolatopsis nigrescens]